MLLSDTATIELLPMEAAVLMEALEEFNGPRRSKLREAHRIIVAKSLYTIQAHKAAGGDRHGVVAFGYTLAEILVITHALKRYAQESPSRHAAVPLLRSLHTKLRKGVEAEVLVEQLRGELDSPEREL